VTGYAYDALVLQSFGGPEGPDDVLPFLRNVTRGRNVPPERLAEVAEHYQHFGGVSPINEQNRALLAAIRDDLAGHGVDLPVYWGNRNWRPYLGDTVRQMRDDGVRRALSFVTSAYGSYSACRQYYEDIDRARAEAGEGAPVIDKLRHYFNHPGFVEPHADGVRAALRTLGATAAPPRLVFTAHSIPESMDASSGPAGRLYSAQVTIASGLVAEQLGAGAFDVAWQSRSGPPQVPWLVPDVNDHLAALAEAGVTDVVVSPIGFVSDHLEVAWDLDEEAAATASKLGLGYARAGTPGTDPRFVAMVRELVLERLEQDAPRRALGGVRPAPDRCPDGCCR
jgi:ferrochelatase